MHIDLSRPLTVNSSVQHYSMNVLGFLLST